MRMARIVPLPPCQDSCAGFAAGATSRPRWQNSDTKRNQAVLARKNSAVADIVPPGVIRMDGSGSCRSYGRRRERKPAPTGRTAAIRKAGEPATTLSSPTALAWTISQWALKFAPRLKRFHNSPWQRYPQRPAPLPADSPSVNPIAPLAVIMPCARICRPPPRLGCKAGRRVSR